jgi:3-oxoacyl-[acyl-carrier protein] reductase
MSTLDSRVAIVTGAANGIGKAIGRRLSADGHPVVLVDLDGARLAEALEGLPAARGITGDVTDSATIDAAIAAAQALGTPAILVSNAGIPGRVGPIETQEDADWDRVLAIMLTAAFRWSRAMVPLMKAAGWGRIVYIASVAGKEGNPNIIPYSVAKAGLIVMGKALAKEVATSGILVNSVAPAVIDTPWVRSLDPKLVEYMLTRIPMGRMGRPEEVAAAVSWLTSDEASFTTGQVLDLSGGRATY